jgi:hypothetical protein
MTGFEARAASVRSWHPTFFSGVLSMFKSKSKLIVACLTAASAWGSAQAATVFSTGFEAPTYAAGALAAQDGWAGAGTVQSAVVGGGSQALQLSGTGAAYASHGISYAIGTDRVSVQTSFFVPTGTSVSQAGIAVTGNTGFIGQLDNVSGLYALGNVNANTSPVAFAAGVWHLLDIEFDFTTKIMAGFVDGTSLGSIAINNAAQPSMLTGLTLFFQGQPSTAATTMYFDNVSVSNVPEPGPMALVGLALAGLCLASRKRA